MITSQAIQKISKDLISLRKNPIDGIEIVEPDTLSELKAIIRAPNSTPYENGEFIIRLQFGTDFPQAPPKAYFLTKIFHPNIEIKTGEICVNTLKRDWKSSLGLKHVLLVIRCLMIEPNPDSALNAEAGHLLNENYDQFVAKARMFTQIHAQKSRASVHSQIPPSFTSKSSPAATGSKKKSLSSLESSQNTMTDSKENNRYSSNTFSSGNFGGSSCVDPIKSMKTLGSSGTGGMTSPTASAATKKKKTNKKKRGLRRL